MDLTNNENKLLNLFSKNTELSHLEKIKLIYGWRLIIADVRMLLFLYSFAMLIGCFIETFLIHISFYAFRQVAFGIHCRNYYICLFVSSITLPVSAMFLKNIEISEIYIWIVYCIAIFVLLLFAPIGTNVNAIRGKSHALYLKKKIYIRLTLFGIILFILPVTITKFLVTGLIIETTLVIASIIKTKGE